MSKTADFQEQQWAGYMDNNFSIPPAHCPIPRGTSYGDRLFQRIVNSEDDGDTIRIESPEGNKGWHAHGYRVVALIENGSGFLIGAKITSRTPDSEGDEYYIATYAVDGVAGVETVPEFIGVALDKKMNERLAAAAVQL